MRDKIFVPSFGNKPSELVGRDIVLNEVKEYLSYPIGSKERAIIILGQRGIGKTVFLHEIASVAKELNYVVAKPTVTEEGMLKRIVEKIEKDSHKKEDKYISGFNAGVLGVSAGVTLSKEIKESKSYEYQLTELAEILTEQGKGILIIIDELRCSVSELKKVVVTYQEMVGEGFNVAIVMAGLPEAVSSVINDSVLTFLYRAKQIKLEPIAINEINIYYRSIFRKLNIKMSDEMIAYAAVMTEGSAYLLQLIGHYIVLATDDEGNISEKTLKETIDLALNEYKIDVCKATIANLSDKDLEFLKSMAIDLGDSSISDIANRMNVSYDYVQKYRIRLIDKGIIESYARGKVRFTLPYLYEYLLNL